MVMYFFILKFFNLYLGTGKTAAFIIPALEKLNSKKPKTQALILVPTRELALQTSHVCKTLGKHMGINVMVTTGGTSLQVFAFLFYCNVDFLNVARYNSAS